MAVELAFFTVAALYAIIFIRSEITEWRRNKKRQQLDSKTPYDYALTNAIDERDRLLDELVTLRALNNVQTDTERIRNEIGTILSDDGEGASEVVYGGLNGIPIVQHSDGTISPFPRWDGMSTGAVARAYQATVREDVTKDERLPDNGVEYADLEAIDKAIRDEQKVLCIYRNRNVEGFSGEEMAIGTLAKLRYHYGQTQYAILRVCRNNEGDTYLLRISGEDLDEISLMGGGSHGEIIYRKESR